MADDRKDAPSFKSAAYRAMEPAWELVRDVLAGTTRMREKRDRYLPRMEAENPIDYAARVNRSPFYAATARTLDGLVGMVFRSPPKLSKDADPVLLKHAEDIDGEGNHVEVFSKRSFDSGMTFGLGGILVDYAAVANPDALTKADEQRGNLRPYWVKIDGGQILSVRFGRDGARTVMLQVCIEEKVLLPAGLFGEEEVCQYRVLTRHGPGNIQWAVWRPTTDEKWQMTTGLFQKQQDIPLALYYTGKLLGPMCVQVPLENLAWANVSHFQVASDHRNSLHIACVPILVRKGIQQGTSQVVAAAMGWDLPADATVEWVEHKGSALAASREELRDIEQQMGNLGLSLLAAQPRAVETAEAKRIDAAAQDSQLATAARGLQDALEQAWVFHAAYLGVPAPEVGLDTDFDRLTLSAQEVDSLSAMVEKKQLSLETLWERLIEGGVLPDTFNPDEEKAAIEEESLLTAPDPQPVAIQYDANGDPIPAAPVPPPTPPPGA